MKEADEGLTTKWDAFVILYIFEDLTEDINRILSISEFLNKYACYY